MLNMLIARIVSGGGTEQSASTGIQKECNACTRSTNIESDIRRGVRFTASAKEVVVSDRWGYVEEYRDDIVKAACLILQPMVQNAVILLG